MEKKKYLMIYSRGNKIKKGDVIVEEWDDEDIKDPLTFKDAELICMIPLSFIDKKGITKHLKRGHFDPTG